MNINFFEQLASAVKSGKSVCLATVVKAEGSTPREAGAKMLVFADGKTVGTVGGSLLEKKVIDKAVNMLKSGSPPVIEKFSLKDDDKTGRHSFKGSGDQLYDTDLALFYVIDPKNINVRKLVCRKNRQDENNFTLTLRLDHNNKTVLADENNNTSSYDNNSSYAKPTVYEYTDI